MIDQAKREMLYVICKRSKRCNVRGLVYLVTDTPFIPLPLDLSYD